MAPGRNDGSSGSDVVLNGYLEDMECGTVEINSMSYAWGVHLHIPALGSPYPLGRSTHYPGTFADVIETI